MATFEICVLTGNALDMDMRKLDMTREGLSCIDFPALNQMKKLVEIKMKEDSMSYFPVKNCTNQAQEEEDRPVYLPKLKEIELIGKKLKKAPNLTEMPRLESFAMYHTLVTDMPGMPYQKNSRLSVVKLVNNTRLRPPNLTGGCEQLDVLFLQGNNQTSLPKDYFVGCKIRFIDIRDGFFMDWPNFLPLGASVETIRVGRYSKPDWTNDGSFKGLEKGIFT